MPRVGEPRLTIRLSVAERAALDAAAGAVGVSTGALVREAAVRYGSVVAEQVRRGEAGGRRRNGSVVAVVPQGPVPKVAASAARAVELAPAEAVESSVVPGPVRVDSPEQVRAWAQQRAARPLNPRQVALNKAKGL